MGTSTSGAAEFLIRLATTADVDAIAAAHLDSIRTIGSLYYEPAVVENWGTRVCGDLYVRGMARGVTFFIAVETGGATREVLGFSSHEGEGEDQGIGVYVRGRVARSGIGSALLRYAEAEAIRTGAVTLHIDASLAAVDFYRKHGFEEIGRGEHRLESGRSMACVFMRKRLGG